MVRLLKANRTDRLDALSIGVISPDRADILDDWPPEQVSQLLRHAEEYDDPHEKKKEINAAYRDMTKWVTHPRPPKEWVDEAEIVNPGADRHHSLEIALWYAAYVTRRTASILASDE